MNPIVGVGMVTLDIAIEVARYPKEGETVSISSRRLAVGGQTARSTTIARRLGSEAVFLGMRGVGEEAKLLEAILNHEGLEARLFVDEAYSPSQHSFVVHTPTPERTIFWWPQPRATKELEDAVAQVVPGASIILVDDTDPVLLRCVTDCAARASVPICIDTGGFKCHSEEAIRGVEIVVMPEKFLRARHPKLPLEEGLRAVADASDASLLVATSGDRGGTALNHRTGEMWRYAPFLAAQVDSIGAGDAFRAGLAVAWVRKAPARDATDFAAWVAGRKVSGRGDDAVPTPDEVQAWWHSRCPPGSVKT